MRRPFIIFFLLTSLLLEARQITVLVSFCDKGPEASFYITHPGKYLSLASLERRFLAGITPDLSDVPVSEQYMQVLQQKNITVLNSSRWLNAALTSMQPEQLHELLVLPFVSGIEVWYDYPANRTAVTGTQNLISYGASDIQNKMVHVDYLHDQGFTGNRVLVGVFDAGFKDVNTLNAFAYMRSKGRIQATRDLVNNDGDVFSDDTHGMNVLSILAANLPGTLVGTGFDADFILARTENSSSENHSEEYNWLRAAEWADSMGVKIIQSSLGYSDFDIGQTSYTQADMDGKTTIISKAAAMAARKGILVVNSAGNEGNKSFRSITAPADADSILAVGAVDATRVNSPLSGHGPSADGRVKPDVCAMGGGASFYTTSNTVGQGTGTSFSAPVISGLCACLWQKHPYVTNLEIIDAIRRSSDRYNTPDTLYGYGIPDAFIADTILNRIEKGRGIAPQSFYNTINWYVDGNQYLHSDMIPDTEMNLTLIDVSGKTIRSILFTGEPENLSDLPSGIYFIRINELYAGKIMLP